MGISAPRGPRVVLACILLLLGMTLGAQTLFPQHVYSCTSAADLSLLPEGSLLERYVSPDSDSDHSLYLELRTSTTRGEGHSLQELLEYIRTISTAFSTQEGITYISRRAGGVRKVLLRSSFQVRRPGGTSALPDPSLPSAPFEGVSYTVFQEDTTFGEVYYSYQYEASGDELIVRIENLTPLKVFSLIPVLKSRALTVLISVRVAQDSIEYYALASAPVSHLDISILGYQVDLADAYLRRMEALLSWFQEELNARFL